MPTGIGWERVDRDNPTCTGKCAAGEVAVGAIIEWVGTQQDQEFKFAIGGCSQRRQSVVLTGLLPETQLKRTNDVAAAKRRQHCGARYRVEHGLQRSQRSALRFSEVAAANHHHHVALCELGHNSGIGKCLRDHRRTAPRCVPLGAPCIPTHAGLLGRELDQLGALLFDRIAKTEIEDRQLLFEVGAEQDHRWSVSRLGYRRPVQSEDLSWQAIAELSVASLDANRIGQLGPRVGTLVGAAGTADQADRTGTASIECTLNQLPRHRCGATPRRFSVSVSSSNEWRGEALVRLDRFKVEATAIAHPTPVDRFNVDALEPQQFVAARIDRDPATDRTRRAGRLDLFKIPRSGLEAIRLGGQRANRADLHDVAREVRREGLVRERVDL